MSDMLQSSIFWVGFAQWLLFFPLVRLSQDVLVPEAGQLVEAALEVIILAAAAGVLLLLPLWGTGHLPLPRGPELKYYMWAFLSGGLLSIPLRAFLARRSSRAASSNNAFHSDGSRAARENRR